MKSSNRTSAKPRTNKKNPKNLFASLGALGISAIFHIFIFLLVGSVVIFEGKIPPVQFFGGMDELSGPLDAVEEIPLIEEDPVLLDTSISDSELEPDSAPMEAGAAAASIDVITASTPTSAFSLPTGMTGPSLNLQSIASGSGKGKGQGAGRGIVGSIFGKSITAEKLGVILDVSFSTHSVLSSVVDEIQKSFPDAYIVFVPGCSISARKSEIVPISAYTETTRKYEEAKFTTTNFINTLLTQSDFKQLWDRANGQGTGKVIFSEVNNHHGVAGCDLAMRHLADHGADAIYWFADFDDTVNPEISSKIATHLAREGIKLIMHDFKGSHGKFHNMETLKMMAERTGGEFFLKFLN